MSPGPGVRTRCRPGDPGRLDLRSAGRRLAGQQHHVDHQADRHSIGGRPDCGRRRLDPGRHVQCVGEPDTESAGRRGSTRPGRRPPRRCRTRPIEPPRRKPISSTRCSTTRPGPGVLVIAAPCPASAPSAGSFGPRRHRRSRRRVPSPSSRHRRPIGGAPRLAEPGIRPHRVPGDRRLPPERAVPGPHRRWSLPQRDQATRRHRRQQATGHAGHRRTGARVLSRDAPSRSDHGDRHRASPSGRRPYPVPVHHPPRTADRRACRRRLSGRRRRDGRRPPQPIRDRIRRRDRDGARRLAGICRAGGRASPTSSATTGLPPPASAWSYNVRMTPTVGPRPGGTSDSSSRPANPDPAACPIGSRSTRCS